MQTGVETCENCGRMIGKLETPELHEGYVVCRACKQTLGTASSRATEVDYAEDLRREATRLGGRPNSATAMRGGMTAVAGASPCPNCGSKMPPKKQPKGRLLVLIGLLILGLLPGVLYMIFCSGYVYACPACGFKRGDAI